MEKWRTCNNNDNVIFQRYLIYCSGDIHIKVILLCARHFTMKSVWVCGRRGGVVHRKESFEDTKGVIRNHKSEKNRQYNGIRYKGIRTNSDVQNNSLPSRHFIFKCPCQAYYILKEVYYESVAFLVFHFITILQIFHIKRVFYL